MNKKIANEPFKFHFNPFGGLSDQEVLNVIVPTFNIDTLIDLLHSKDQLIIELVGQKGRGKTLHLRCLHLILKDAPIFYLGDQSNLKELIQNKSEVILVDSIHHLNLFYRIQLFKQKKKIILTTHHSKKWEYLLAGRSSKKIRFKGINRELLKKIIENRIQIASNNFDIKSKIDNDKIDNLIEIYKDDFRAILNHLYDEFSL